MTILSREVSTTTALAARERDIQQRTARVERLRRNIEELEIEIARQDVGAVPAATELLHRYESRYYSAQRELAKAREALNLARTIVATEQATAVRHTTPTMRSQEYSTMIDSSPTVPSPNTLHLLKVLKPFKFTYPSGLDRPFPVGDHYLDPINSPLDAELLAHRWISRDFADGHIERPEIRQARESEQKAAMDAAIERARALRAEVASMPAPVMDVQRAVSDPAALTDELNTPLNERKIPNAKEVEAELNTPLNQLRKV